MWWRHGWCVCVCVCVRVRVPVRKRERDWEKRRQVTTVFGKWLFLGLTWGLGEAEGKGRGWTSVGWRFRVEVNRLTLQLSVSYVYDFWSCSFIWLILLSRMCTLKQDLCVTHWVNRSPRHIQLLHMSWFLLLSLCSASKNVAFAVVANISPTGSWQLLIYCL